MPERIATAEVYAFGWTCCAECGDERLTYWPIVAVDRWGLECAGCGALRAEPIGVQVSVPPTLLAHVTESVLEDWIVRRHQQAIGRPRPMH